MHYQPPPRDPVLDAFTGLIGGALAFTSADSRAFVRVPAASPFGFRTFSVRSTAFRTWFDTLASARLDRIPTAHAWSAICRHLEAEALRDSRLAAVATFRRTAWSADGALLLDLANRHGEYIEILPTGWRLTSGESGAPFETTPGATDLPAPELPDPAESDPLDALRAILNLGAPDSTSWLRVLTWLLAALRPAGPYPMLVLRGPAASGKTYAARILRILIDPSAAPFVAIPRTARQLLHLARHNWVLAFDHISRLSPAIAGALCRITSGDGLAFREPGHLEPVHHWIRRPIVLTLAESCDLPPEIASRALIVDLPPLAPEARLPEPALNQLIEARLPKILGALCTALSKCLAAQPAIASTATRHVTAVSWAAPIHPGIRDAVDQPPPPHPFIQSLEALLAAAPTWTGTAADLLVATRAAADPASLSRLLNTLTLPLADAGIQVRHHRKKDRRLITLIASPFTQPSAIHQHPGLTATPDPVTSASKHTPAILKIPMQIEKVYEPQRFEPHWAQWWIDNNIFAAPADAPGRVFSLVIPPPNVTGVLHIGHMLEHAEIDVTIRWHRMLGDNTLWLPGTDHAGIATQMVVARQLADEGINYRSLGREKFEARVWEWKAKSGDTIKRQMVRLGASCDWSRERFTLDPGLSRAVREVFVRLYEKGLIYRGEYMITWCPDCQTAISDLETDHKDVDSHLWHIRYPVNGLPDTYVTVATTRPETMLGDTAVAINAQDARYTHLHGRTVTLPLMNREIPIILDDLADPKFGTGVVKVTPAHDLNDFEAGRRHNLPKIQVIGEDAKMTAAAGPYAGLDRFEARKRVVADLEKTGALVKIEDYKLSLGICQRSKTPIEPLISTQWFVKTKPLAEPAIKAVEDGRIQFVPPNWVKTYNEWMYNIRDWCISRQLWWGHRVPAWYCENKHMTVAREEPKTCPQCGSAKLLQDTDVLDTWFSSGLWPFSTLGWPDQTPDLAKFYPTSLLITGFDILFFWVARMAMLGIEFMGDVPFRQVYIHGLVRDAERQKMSKTKGNVIDPLVVTEKYGTDAVRMALLQGAAPGTDIVLTEERMESSRAFANKIWNAARFFEPAQPAGPPSAVEDRWIFSRLNTVAQEANRAIEQYRYHEYAQLVWHFFWHEFCDWYIELKKVPGATSEHATRALETALRLLHPAMPFLTEELWQRLGPHAVKSIAVAPYPQYDPKLSDAEAEKEIAIVQDVVTMARTIRTENKLDPKQQFTGTLSGPAELLAVARRHAEAIHKIARVQLACKTDAPPLHLVLDLPEIKADPARQQKECEQLKKNIANSKRQLGDEVFLSKAPPHIVESIRTKLADYEAQLTKLHCP